MERSGFLHAMTAGLCVLVLTASTAANLLSDSSFENAIDPLPGLGPVVGPPFSPGFWGAEFAGEVPAERGVTPFHLQHMLYMENEGLVVTQAFQAVDVTADATLIDSGQAVADFRAWVNANLPGIPAQDFRPGLLFFAGANDWPTSIGSQFWSQPLDFDPNTWEPFVAAHPVPVNTRWIVVQLGYADAFLPFGERAYVDAASLRIIPEPGTLTLLAVGLLAGLRRRR